MQGVGPPIPSRNTFGTPQYREVEFVNNILLEFIDEYVFFVSWIVTNQQNAVIENVPVAV